MASRMFSSASSSVSPSDQQPGKPGTDTLTPSSVRWSKTLYRIVTSASHDNRALRLQTPFRLSDDQAQNGTQKCGTHKCHPLSRNAQEQISQGLWKSFSNLARSAGVFLCCITSAIRWRSRESCAWILIADRAASEAGSGPVATSSI